MFGVVTDFDEPRGLGAVRADPGTDLPFRGTDLPFHCTAVADGSRDIAVGTPVVFEVVAGLGGQWEAARIEPR